MKHAAGANHPGGAAREKEYAMERLLFLDGGDYTDDMPETVRIAVRGIIFADGKLLLIEDNKREVKLPGGGQEAGETDLETLTRDVREETGYTVMPDTVRPFGYIEEKRKSFNENVIWHQFSRLYFCDVADERGATAYSETRNDAVCAPGCTRRRRRSPRIARCWTGSARRHGTRESTGRCC